LNFGYGDAGVCESQTDPCTPRPVQVFVWPCAAANPDSVSEEFLVRSARGSVDVDGGLWIEGVSYQVLILAVEPDPMDSLARALAIGESLSGINALAASIDTEGPLPLPVQEGGDCQ
jgi:hypothetical protein